MKISLTTFWSRCTHKGTNVSQGNAHWLYTCKCVVWLYTLHTEGRDSFGQEVTTTLCNRNQIHVQEQIFIKLQVSQLVCTGSGNQPPWPGKSPMHRYNGNKDATSGLTGRSHERYIRGPQHQWRDRERYVDGHGAGCLLPCFPIQCTHT